MRSAAQIQASKTNGARSRGPVTEEGKARACWNALRDGNRSATLILPGENGQQFEREHDQLIEDLQPRDGSEHKLVHEIASADWFLDRVRRAQFERLKCYIEGADGREDDDVARTLDRLFADVSGPLATYALSGAFCGGPRTSFPEKVDDSQKPPALVKRLEGTAKGCQAMIDCWREIAGRVANDLELQPQDRLRLVRMLAKQPVDAALDQRVWLIYSASFALHPAGKEHAFLDLKSEIGTNELDEFVDRVQSRWPLLLDASETSKCKQSLLDLIAQNVERLETRRGAHLEVADARKASNAARLAYEESPQGERLARHELACQRRTHRCRDAFWKHRRESEKDGGREGKDGGRRTEDGGRTGEDGGQDGGQRTEGGGNGCESSVKLGAESGVGEEVSSAPGQNLTNEPKVGMSASEVAGFTEVAACEGEIKRGLAELSRLRELGIVTSGTRVGGDGNGLAAIVTSIAKRGPLLPPIS